VIELQDLLDQRARLIDPSLDALDRVIGTAHKRHRRRRVAASSAALCLVASAVTAIVVPLGVPGSRPGVPQASQFVGSAEALAVRTALGVDGATKGAPDSVVVTERTRAGRVSVSLVHMRTGRSMPVQVGTDDTSAPSVSPRGDVVATVTGRGVVLASPTEARQAVIPDTEGAEGQVSWDGTGSALFTRVNGGWVRVTNAGPAPGPEMVKPLVEPVIVPSIPGGPILLSVSPGGDVVAMFGITYPEGLPPVPHLYVGSFDGSVVTDPQEIEIPAGALAGPMGWVGDNAFLLAPEPGRALLVHTEGSRIEVRPQGMENPCRAVSTVVRCIPDGPSLLGTNADGSLLFWKVSALYGPARSAPPILVLYYKTWLDGSHGVRLTGLAGRFGPPVAPR
jgi:hypothetical protein